MHTTIDNSNRPEFERDVPQSTRRELSPLRLITALLRHRRLILACVLILPLIVGASLLVSPRVYTAHASFIPYVRSGSTSSLQGLAAQFGVEVPGTDPTQSVFFYADLLRSTDLLGGLVDTRFTAPDDDGVMRTQTLLEFLKPKGATPALRRDRAITELRAQFHVNMAEKSGIINVTCTLPSAELARATTDRAIALINEFNILRRRSQASQERQFAERRVTELRAELAAINERWLTFLRANRGFTGNFEQTFENEKFAREAEVQKGVLAALRNTYEQAKMDEVRTTPVITVIDKPMLPTAQDPRGIVMRTTIALFAGLFLGILLALWKEFARITNADGIEREYHDYIVVRNDTIADIRRYGGPLRWVVPRLRD